MTLRIELAGREQTTVGQYFGLLMWRADSLEKTLRLGNTEGRRSSNRGWNGWMAPPMQSTWVKANSRRWVKDREARRAAVHGVAESSMTEQLNNKLNNVSRRNGCPHVKLGIVRAGLGTLQESQSREPLNLAVELWEQQYLYWNL